MRDFREYLSNPNIFPHPVEAISFIETHISLICLTGAYVYKLKKPVVFGNILDFSTLAKRQYYCHEELRLNRRLAPDLYKSVVCLHPDGIQDHLDEQYEFAVRMKELPQDAILENQLNSGQGISMSSLNKILGQLVAFYHSTGRPHNGIHFQHLREKITENFQTLSALVEVDDQYRRKVEKYMEEHEQLFCQRIQDGKIVDGHGDLHPKNIFVDTNRVIIFDCIEFNPLLRIVDQAEDIAFFLVELEKYNLVEQSNYFARSIAKKMNDETLEEILPFYKAYRSSVNQKVLLFRRSELDDDQEQLKNDLLAEANIYDTLARRYMEE